MARADLGDADPGGSVGRQESGERSQGESGEQGSTVHHFRSQAAALARASAPSVRREADGKSEASFSPATQSG